MKLITFDQPIIIDRTTFCWIFPAGSGNQNSLYSVYPPAIWKTANVYYQLNYFDTINDEYFLLEDCDFTDAFLISVGFYGRENLNIVELSNLLCLAESFGYSATDFDIFEKYGVSGERKIRTLRMLKDFSAPLKGYLAVKNPSFRTLNLLVKLPDNIVDIVESYLETENPSVSDFKKIVTKLFDMKDEIPEKLRDFDKNELEKIFSSKNSVQQDFLKELTAYADKLNSVDVKNYDNFETDTLYFAFKINSPEEFETVLNNLLNKKDVIEDIYNLLEKYDLH